MMERKKKTKNYSIFFTDFWTTDNLSNLLQ